MFINIAMPRMILSDPGFYDMAGLYVKGYDIMPRNGIEAGRPLVFENDCLNSFIHLAGDDYGKCKRKQARRCN